MKKKTFFLFKAISDSARSPRNTINLILIYIFCQQLNVRDVVYHLFRRWSCSACASTCHAQNVLAV
jgi:hypothetical protein